VTITSLSYTSYRGQPSTTYGPGKQGFIELESSG
jgi:hypothetical protein